MRDPFIMTQKLEEAKQYWLSKLSSLPGEIKLIPDIPRMKSNKCEQAEYRVVLDGALTRQANQISKDNHLSLYVLLLSFLKILLFKLTGQEDIIVSSPTYGAGSREYNKFVPMRDFLSAGMSFKDVLMRVKQTVSEGYRNQYFPIENLLEILELPNDFSLARVILLLENIHEKEFSRDFSGKYEKDIIFSYRFDEGTLRADIIYNSGLFREKTIEQLWGWYLRIMEQVFRDKEIPLKRIELITEKEKHKVLFEFNNTHRSYSVDGTLHGLFTDQCVKTPANTVIVAPSPDIAPTSPIPGSPKLNRLHLTYGELNNKSDRFARQLREKGSGPGVIAGLLLDSNLEMIVTILGVLKTGGSYLPIDTASPEEKVRFVLKDSGAAILITDRGKTLTDSGPTIIPPEPDCDTMYPCPGAGTAAEPLPKKVASGEAAYVIYTSGTTGNPKGVIITHQNVVNTLVARKEIYDTGSQIVALQLFPYSFDGFITGFFTPVISGARVVLLSEEKRKDVMEIKNAILRHCVTHFICVPALFQVLIEGLTAQDASVLRLVTLAGDRIIPEIVRKAREKNPALEISNEYGVTECSVMSTINRNQERNETILVGKPVWNTRLYIVDTQNMLLPVGIPGELCIAGAGVAAGYLNRPELTAEKFLSINNRHYMSYMSHTSHRSHRYKRFYRTGDLARWHPTGNIELLGRIDHQVKIRGFRIELEEIERQLLRHENIKAAVVTVKEDMRADRHLAAYMVTHKEFGVEEMRTYLSRYLPDYMVPAYMIRLDKIPVTVNGKVDTRALPEPEIPVGPVFQPPRHETEHTLAQIWADVLGIEKEKIGIDANFFQLGGNSLKVTFLGAHIQKHFNIKITLSEIFNLPTIRELADYIKEAVKDRYIPIEAAESKEYYDLTPTQMRLYFLQQAYPGSIGYNIPIFVEMKGLLDIERFNRTIERLIKRHDSLRTSFLVMGNRLVQRILREVEFTNEYYDLQASIGSSGTSGTPGAADAVDVDPAAGFVRPFDLSRAPLFRLGLVKTGAESSILMVDLHHIICDGTSQHILRREFTELYEENHLAPLKLQYKDYSEWWNHGNQRASIKNQGDYWVDLFSAEVPVLNLPTDYPRPAELNFEGASLTFLLSEEETALLNKIAKENDATLYMVLLSVMNILLAKLSGQEDIIIGTPIAARRRTELEGIVGMFVNTLAMRNYPSSEKTFTDFLRELKQNTLGAYENQEYPFEELVDRIMTNRDAGRNPLFDVMFALQNMDHQEFKMPGLKMEPYTIADTASKFDLTLTAVEREQRLYLSFDYSTRLFKKESIESFSRYFKQILKPAAARPHGKISGIAIITDPEKRQILAEFNETGADYPKDKTIPQLFEEQVEKIPSGIVIVNDYTQLTYAVLNERANRLARVLKPLGAKPDSITGIMLDKSVDMVIAILGILKAGGAYLPVDPAYPESRKRYMIRDSNAAVLLTDMRRKGEIPGNDGLNVFCLDGSGDIISRQKTGNLPGTATPNHLAYVIYTSGSTGKPKGVLIDHASVANLKTWQSYAFGIGEGSRVMQFFSYGFDGAVGETFMAVLNGATLVMLGMEALSPGKLMAAINRHRLNFAVFVPSMIRQMDPAQLTHQDFTIVSVGEACPVDLVQKWSARCTFVNGYGPTETTVYSHTWKATGEEYITRSNSVPIGKPISNYASYILDPHHNPVAIGVTGEIYISGAGVARGYLNRPEITAERFVTDKFHPKEEKYTEKGDLMIASAGREIAEFKRLHARGTFKRKDLKTPAPGKISREEIIKLIENIDPDLVDKTRMLIETNEYDPIFGGCFYRYLLEGQGHSYFSCGINEELLKRLVGTGEFRGKSGIDFGIGNAEILQLLSTAGAAVMGFDFNPFFIQSARERGLNAQMLRIDADPETFKQESGLEEGAQDFALSTLVLDRIENPGNLLENLFWVIKPGGRCAIQTLLPIVPVDDGDVEEPIVYTPVENRLTPGRNIEEDTHFLISRLYKLGAREICVHRFPYVVCSNDGIQDYTVWSFTGIKTARKNPAVFNNSNPRSYKTGDLGCYLPDGNIEFLGRIDHQVKIRGFRIEMGEVESRLLNHPGIIETVVIPIKESGSIDGAPGASEDKDTYTNLCAYYVSDREYAPAELRENLAKELPHYMIPSYFVRLEKIPLTPNGKLDRKALPIPKPVLKDDYVAPSSEKEKLVAEAWKKVLHLETVGINDNLFEVGGNSINCIKIALYLKKILGKEDIPLAKLFQYPTIAAFAKYLDEDRNALSIPAQKQEWHQEAANVKNRLKQRRERNK